MHDLRKDFPVLEKYTYLNTASCGLLPKPVAHWRMEHDQQLLNEGSVFRDRHKPHIQRIRNTVAGFLDASPTEIALIPNFSFGFNTVLEGIPKDSKVLLLKTDYPSINWAVENRDFVVFYAEIDENLEVNIEEAINRHQPDVFAFSLVQYLNGIKINLNFLKQLKAYHPELLLVADGTQCLGTERFSFSDNAIDVIGASSYKWLLSGYGNGFFAVKDSVQTKILPRSIGFNSADATFGNRDSISFVKLFEPGHQDTLNYGSMEQALLYLEKLGMDDCFSRISEIAQLARARFNEAGLLSESVIRREEHSNIFNLRTDRLKFDRLHDANVICSWRGGGIRVSFHFYNTEEDLAKLMEVLKT